MENRQVWHLVYTARARERQLRDFFMQRGLAVQAPEVRMIRHGAAGSTIAHVPCHPHRLLVRASSEELAVLAYTAPVHYRFVVLSL